MAAFGPSTTLTGLGADAAAEVLSRRLSHQPNPSSLSQHPKPVPVPLSLTPLWLLSTSPNPLSYSDPNSRNSRLSSRHCQSVEHASPDSDKLASLTV
jgi:hypothetical protein